MRRLAIIATLLSLFIAGLGGAVRVNVPAKAAAIAGNASSAARPPAAPRSRLPARDDARSMAAARAARARLDVRAFVASQASTCHSERTAGGTRTTCVRLAKLNPRTLTGRERAGLAAAMARLRTSPGSRAATAAPAAAPVAAPAQCDFGMATTNYPDRFTSCASSVLTMTTYQTQDGVTTITGQFGWADFEWASFTGESDAGYWSHGLIAIGNGVASGKFQLGADLIIQSMCDVVPGTCTVTDTAPAYTNPVTLTPNGSFSVLWAEDDAGPAATTAMTSDVLDATLGVKFTWPGDGTNTALTKETTGTGLAGRCDSFFKDPVTLNYAIGCVDERFTPTLVYDSIAYPQVAPVAQHIYLAQNTLAIAWGVDPRYRANGAPLTRDMLQSDIDANRAVACPPASAPPPPDSCDEFPMASTHEGANFNPVYSTAIVPQSANDSQGGITGNFYTGNRVIDPDPFFVSVVLPPAGNTAGAWWIPGVAAHAGNDYPYQTIGQFGHTNEGTDAWNEYYGQCDSFAAWKVYENLASSTAQAPARYPAPGWQPGNASVSPVNQFTWGNADAWATRWAALGYTVDNVPIPGAIAWWPNAVPDPQDDNPPDAVHGIPGSTTGHVGYVRTVYPDGSIDVEQYNMRENGEYSIVHLAYDTGYTDNSFGDPDFAIPWPGGFIHVDDGPAPGVGLPTEPASGVVYDGYAQQAGLTVIGPGSSTFTLSGAAYPGTTNGWYSDAGHGELGRELWTNSHPGAADSTATWDPYTLANFDCYEVDAFVPDNWSNNEAAVYTVTDQGNGTSLIPVDETKTTNDWVELGVFQARDTAGTTGKIVVTLTDQGSGSGQVAADAMRFVQQPDCGGLVRASQTLDYPDGMALGGVPQTGTVNGWYASPGHGQLGNQYYTYTNGMTPSSSASATVIVIPNACYEILAYVPGNHADDYQAMYTIDAAGGSPTVSVDENAYTDNFAGLGTYRAKSNGEIGVLLTDQSLDSGDAYVSADTISFVHVACPATVEGANYPALTAGPGSPLSQFWLISDWYNRFGHGDLGYEKWTNDNGTSAPISTAVWNFGGLPAGTTYSVCAFIPDNYANNTAAHYQGYQGSGNSPAFSTYLNQANATGWTYIGVLGTGTAKSLTITLDDTGPATDANGNPEYTAADAIRLTTGAC